MTERKDVDGGKQHKAIGSSGSENRKGAMRGVFTIAARGLHLTGPSGWVFVELQASAFLAFSLPVCDLGRP